MDSGGLYPYTTISCARFLSPKLYPERSVNNRLNSRQDARGIQEGHAVAVMVNADALAIDGACGHNSPKRGLLTAPALKPVLRNLGYTSPPYMPVKFATLV